MHPPSLGVCRENGWQCQISRIGLLLLALRNFGGRHHGSQLWTRSQSLSIGYESRIPVGGAWEASAMAKRKAELCNQMKRTYHSCSMGMFDFEQVFGVEVHEGNADSFLSDLEKALNSILKVVIAEDRYEFLEQEREQRSKRNKLRRQLAALKKAEAEAEKAKAALVAAIDAEEATKPLVDKMAASLGSMVDSAMTATMETVINSIDPSLKSADEAVERAKAAEEAEKARRRQYLQNEMRRIERRMRQVAPPEELFVKFANYSDPMFVKEMRKQAVVVAPFAQDERSRLFGSQILLDIGHLDFQTRLQSSHESLSAYIALLVSGHYKERAYQLAGKSRVDYSQAYQEITKIYCHLERGLLRFTKSFNKV